MMVERWVAQASPTEIETKIAEYEKLNLLASQRENEMRNKMLVRLRRALKEKADAPTNPV